MNYDEFVGGHGVSQAASISQQIWDMKYRLKSADGRPVDKTLEETWARIVGALAAAEPESQRESWTRKFNESLTDYKFLPAGRILSGAGTALVAVAGHG